MLLVIIVVRCERFHTFGQKACATAIVLLTPPTAAIALSTIHAQFFLAVATAVILISDAEQSRKLRSLSLGLAAFTGITSAILAPLFLFQAYRERSRARMFQTMILVAGLAVQCAVLYSQPRMLHGPHSTFGFYSASVVGTGMLEHFFTRTSLQEACKVVGSPKIAAWRGLFWLVMEVGAALVVATLLFVSVVAGRSVRLLIWAGLIVLTIGFKRSGAIDLDLMCGSGGRYFFAFNILASLSLLLLWQRRLPRWSALAAVLIAGSILSGLLELNLMEEITGPVWSNEVAAWRADPQYQLQLRPGYWPGLKLTAQPGNKSLPSGIYDTTNPGWEEK